ncbi:hypothetical protein RB195_004269 [Necator americanus]|uniref:Uncharacterized protein n=1 Tax=Necator americanus TaxID=51031 RepID=A0ABR1BKN1_NECAM
MARDCPSHPSVTVNDPDVHGGHSPSCERKENSAILFLSFYYKCSVVVCSCGADYGASRLNSNGRHFGQFLART